jgi:hypothetical protein
MLWLGSDWLAPQMAARGGWLQAGQICSSLLPIAFPAFIFSLFIYLFGTAAVPRQQATAAGYTSLARGANEIAGNPGPRRSVGSIC